MEILVAILIGAALLAALFLALKMVKLILRLVLLALFAIVLVAGLLTFGRPLLERGARALHPFLPVQKQYAPTTSNATSIKPQQSINPK